MSDGQVVLLASEYTKSIDVWSVGCAERELNSRGVIKNGDFNHQGPGIQ